MRIELASLDEGKGTFAHTYTPGELVLDNDRMRLLVEPTVSGNIRRKERRVHVNGQVAARVALECDRCLKPVEAPVDSTFKLEYVTREDYQAQQAIELSGEDLDLSIFDGEAIDIDELVKEELVLAVPDHVLCNDNCRGICPVCGADRNAVDCNCQTTGTDPRWAGLKELVNGKS